MRRKPFEASRGRVLAVCLILAVLLCHGVYGAGHQLTPAYETHEEHSAHTHEEKGAHPAGHLSGMAYAAVLLIFFIAAVSTISFARAKPEVMRPQPSLRFSPPDVSRLPRGPTLHFLQVLRL